MAIDTSTETCSVALWNGNSIFAQFEECKLEQSKRILPLVKTVLNQSNTVLNKLNAISFGCGPGSFTGIRISVGIAQGLALGATLPVIGVSTLATMAQGAWRKTGATHVLVAIDARMNEIYWAQYSRDKNNLWNGKETEAILKYNAVEKRLKQLFGKWAIVGTGWKTYPNMVKNSNTLSLVDVGILFPEARDILPIAYRMFISGNNRNSVAVENAEPVYLRNTVVKKDTFRI